MENVITGPLRKRQTDKIKEFDVPETLSIHVECSSMDDVSSNSFEILGTGEIKSMHGFSISYKKGFSQMNVNIFSLENERKTPAKAFLRKGKKKITKITLTNAIRDPHEQVPAYIHEDFVSDEYIDIYCQGDVLLKVPCLSYKAIKLSCDHSFAFFNENSKCGDMVLNCNNSLVKMNSATCEKLFINSYHSTVFDAKVTKEFGCDIKNDSMLTIDVFKETKASSIKRDLTSLFVDLKEIPDLI